VIETAVRDYVQVRTDPHGLIVPAVTVADAAIDDLIRKSVGMIGTSFHLLLQDERTGTYIVEADLNGVRFRIPLEDPPEDFNAMMLLNGLALLPSSVGPDDSSEFVMVGPFDREGVIA
jgi:hypothetical protein